MWSRAVWEGLGIRERLKKIQAIEEVRGLKNQVY